MHPSKTDLSSLSTQELQEELARRRAARAPEEDMSTMESQAEWRVRVRAQEARAHLTCLPMGPIAYPLPAKPFIDQAKAPCIPNEGEVEINGGCWVELARRPPCHEKQAEHGAKCYMPVSARSRLLQSA